MRTFFVLLLWCWTGASAIPPDVGAQHMFIDTNGDGVSNGADRLEGTGETKLDIWIETDRKEDGTIIACGAQEGVPMTINCYEFALKASGGSVEWGTFINNQPNFDLSYGRLSNDTEYYTGFGGLTVLPPGTYKLGSLQVKVKSGMPRIEFASSSSLWGSARTSFCSRCRGVDGEHLQVYRGPRTAGESSGPAGDWSDARGVEAIKGTPELGSSLATVGIEPWSISVSPNPANPEAVIRINTTRRGALKVLLFDITGRLIRTVVDEKSASAGVHIVHIPRKGELSEVASGVYFFKVETDEQSATGKLVILK